MTVSNIKLDDVFSDVFGRAASAITTRLLENNEPFDVTQYLTKNIKAPVEKIQAAVDGEICVEQAEKLRIIRSHIDSLELRKLNLESLVLTIAEKYLPQINLVLPVLGIKSFSAIGIISEIGVDMSVFPTSKHLCSWLALRRRTMRALERRKPPESAVPEFTSNLCSFSAPSAQFVPSSFQKSATAILRSKSAGDIKRPLLLLPECF